MPEERAIEELDMNTFPTNESKETLFALVSPKEELPRPSSPPKKTAWKICGSNYPLSIAFIVVNEFCERFSYYGMKAVLTLYFLYFLHWSEDTSTSVYHAFSSLCYFTPLLGAVMADSWLGKFRTILYLSLVYVLGHVIKSLGAVPVVGGHLMHTVLSMVGLFLIALGTGGIKPCVAAFGGDQFEEEHAKERSRFFSVFYLAINAGSLISVFVTPMLRGDVQCFGGDCYALAFGVPGMLMVLALVVFALGSKMYKKPPPEGNIVVEVSKCIWFAISNRLKNRSSEIPKREHWLDWAEEKYPKQLILEVKALTRVLFLYIPLPMFWALLDQQGSRWTLQATRMNGNMGFFVFQPDQIQVLNPLLVLIFIPMFDLGIYPLVKMCGINLTSIRKMATGMILASLAFAIAATVEIKINELSPHTPGGKEVYLRILNLADDEVKVSLKNYHNNSVFPEPIKPFQKTTDHSKMLLTTESQSFHFQLQYHNRSVTSEHMLEEKNRYSLVIRGDQSGVSSILVKGMATSTANGMAAVRFINTLDKDVNLTLSRDVSLSVGEDYGISDYKTLERGKYHHVQCRTEDKDFSLDLGLLDFGAAYVIAITNSSDQGLQAWKTEDISPNQMSIAWQLPQYIMITAAEVMFSVTGLEFSYAQAPLSMKSVLQAAWLLTVAIGNIIVLIVAQTSALVQWAEFILFSCLLLIVCLIFSIMGYFYIPIKPEDAYNLEDTMPSHIKENARNLVTKKTKL
ncbi:solute carrier family 15 member 2-like [Phascolarctos cinereus]|uniref:Solute carrier family 15 member 2 n=1 Tax=Phascolarctos cinereus TaxID=38626 RepID=A0A6P5K873_PHACI|nr:solute carrier family 15 member 2-like [Phascolarctos cinereus]